MVAASERVEGNPEVSDDGADEASPGAVAEGPAEAVAEPPEAEDVGSRALRRPGGVRSGTAA